LAIRIRIDIADEALASRLAEALSLVGIEVVHGEADFALIPTAGSFRPDEADSSPALTPRELDVLALLAEGASNKEIARRLSISAHTAKFHVSSIIDKLDAVGRTDALVHAAKKGVIEL